MNEDKDSLAEAVEVLLDAPEDVREALSTPQQRVFDLVREAGGIGGE